MSDPQVVSVKFNFGLYASVEFDDDGVQQKTEVDEFGETHHATVRFSDGAEVSGDWFDGGSWTKPKSNGFIDLPWLQPVGKDVQGGKIDPASPYFLAAVVAVDRCGLDGKGFYLPKLPLQLAGNANLGDCEECGEFGVDLGFKGADGRSVCDACRDWEAGGPSPDPDWERERAADEDASTV